MFEEVGTSGRVVPVAFGPGGRLVADGRTDGVGGIRDARDGSLVGRMEHDNVITDVEFDPTGRQDRDGEHGRHGAVWAAKDGALLDVLRGHDDTVATVRFSGDGRSLVTASADGTAGVWDVDTRPQLRLAAIDRACAADTRGDEPGRPDDGTGGRSHGRAHRPLRHSTCSGSTATTSSRLPSAPTGRGS